MPIDIHPHYVPPRILELLREKGRDLGIDVIDRAGACPCLHLKL